MRARLLCIAACLLVAACSAKTSEVPIRDLATYRQDAGAYHELAPNVSLLPAGIQSRAFARFLHEHFGPWERNAPQRAADEVFWGFRIFGEKTLFGENTRQRSAQWIERMRARSRTAAYPSLNRRAITVHNTSMRVFPTSRPAFYDFAKAGEGYPFDYMQNSLVLAGTPLLATHESADGAWILVESRFAYGWVPATDIAWTDDEFIREFRTGTYGAVTSDDTAVSDTDGTYRFTAHIGTILPARPGETSTLHLIPIRNAQGNAEIRTADIAKIEQAPIPATPANFTRLANRMLGSQYGWGGLLENRDCSATLMDLMTAFGIFLPRNSGQQYQHGHIISLDDMTRSEKKRVITSMATPFLTLIRRPGHIMLYVGDKNGQPVVFHTVWGVKTEVNGKAGRRVIGSTAITSLEPGAELDTLAPGGLLLDSVYGMATLPGTTPDH